MKKVAVFLFALFLCASVFAEKKSDKKDSEGSGAKEKITGVLD